MSLFILFKEIFIEKLINYDSRTDLHKMLSSGVLLY